MCLWWPMTSCQWQVQSSMKALFHSWSNVTIEQASLEAGCVSGQAEKRKKTFKSDYHLAFCVFFRANHKLWNHAKTNMLSHAESTDVSGYRGPPWFSSTWQWWLCVRASLPSDDQALAGFYWSHVLLRHPEAQIRGYTITIPPSFKRSTSVCGGHGHDPHHPHSNPPPWLHPDKSVIGDRVEW